MESKKVINKIEKLEKIIKTIDKYLDFKNLKAQGVITDKTLKFIENINNIKNRIKNNQIRMEEILNLKKKINEVRIFLLTKFYHYV